ncbi:glycosyltransferase [Akkermansiaceae bacterium]|nr:glycosyltransferase [Akkermansiaceae bacterium]
MIIGISAIRSKSGGAIAHLRGILEYNPITDNEAIDKVVLFTNSKVAKELKVNDKTIIIDVTRKYNGLLWTLWYELYHLPRNAERFGLGVMLYTDASALVTVRPSLVMSRDMLSFEPGIRKLYSGYKYLRILVIGYVQRYNLKKADVPIFLTSYARDVIINAQRGSIIPHGIEDEWRGFWSDSSKVGELRLLFVGNSAPYKGHLELLMAVSILTKKGVKLKLSCIGGATGSEFEKLQHYITENRLTHLVDLVPFKSRDALREDYLSNDVFIFTSKCENMPNTLVEAVVSGIPVISSDNGPMRELIGNYRYSFNATKAEEIAKAIELYTGDSMEIRMNEHLYLKERFNCFSWKNSSQKLIEALMKI